MMHAKQCRPLRGQHVAFTWQGLFFIICNCRTADVVANGASACGQAPDTTHHKDAA